MSHGRCERATAAWSLASLTVERGAADPDTRALLVQLAREPDPCQTEPSQGSALRVYAVAALGALHDEALVELASKCDGKVTGWQLAFENPAEAMGVLTNQPIARPAGARLPGGERLPLP